MNPIEQAQNLIKSAALLAPFAEKFSAQIESLRGWLSVSVDGVARLNIPRTFSEGDRERLLNAVGETFGRDGWIAKPSVCANSYDWQKTVMDVLITIDDAKALPPIAPHPVQPKDFPILLN